MQNLRRPKILLAFLFLFLHRFSYLEGQIIYTNPTLGGISKAVVWNGTAYFVAAYDVVAVPTFGNYYKTVLVDESGSVVYTLEAGNQSFRPTLGTELQINSSNELEICWESGPQNWNFDIRHIALNSSFTAIIDENVNTVSGNIAATPDFRIGSDGISRLVAFRNAGYALQYYHKTAGNWSSEMTLSSSYKISDMEMVIESDNSIHVLNRANLDPPYNLEHMEMDASHNLLNTTVVDPDLSQIGDFKINSFGQPYVIYSKTDDLYEATFQGGSWTTAPLDIATGDISGKAEFLWDLTSNEPIVSYFESHTYYVKRRIGAFWETLYSQSFTSAIPNNSTLFYRNNELHALFAADNNVYLVNIDNQACDHPDYDALMALYDNTDGPNWTNNSGWVDGAAGTNCDPCTWYGIQCDGNDRVICIDLDGLDDCNYAVSGPGNNLTGTIPDLDMPFLESLILYNNTLSGTIPDFSGLPNLTELNLAVNDLSGSIPDFSGIENLTILLLHFNNLNGNIPDFSNLPNLEGIAAYENNLSGPIPDFSNLPLLLTFNCYANQFTGNIVDFSNLPLLTNYIIAENLLSGPIPDFTNLPQLDLLNCSDNQLTGTIPDFSNTALTRIDVANNQLTGIIPEFPALTLDRLWVGNNQLSGCYPDYVCGLTIFTATGNNELPWMGDHTNFCSGDPQIGAICDDGDGSTSGEVIQDDCSCAEVIVCENYDAFISLSNSNVCEGDQVTITFNFTGGTPPYSLTYYQNATPTMLTGIDNGHTIDITASIDITFGMEMVFDSENCGGIVLSGPSLTVNPTPDAIPAGPYLKCEFDAGGFDLTSLDNTINNGTGNPVEWYQDNALLFPINNPSNYNTAINTTVYAIVVVNGCPSQVIAVDLEIVPNPLEATFLLPDFACVGEVIDLVIDFTNVGGTPPYAGDVMVGADFVATFSDVSGVFSTTFTLNNPGSYDYWSASFVDANGCSPGIVQPAFLTINILPDVQPSFDLSASICQIEAAFALPLVSNEGIPGSWSGDGVNANIFDPLIAGLGAAQITFMPDQGSCGDIYTTTIEVLSAVTPAPLTFPDICVDDGAFDLPLTVEGFSGVWSGTGVFGNQFFPVGLPGLNQLVFTPDDDQCALPTSAVIEVIDLLLFDIQPVSPDCFGGNDGLISFSANGSGNYTFSWSNSFNNTSGSGFGTTISGLVAGSYSFTVTDLNSDCIVSDAATLIQPDVLLLDCEVLSNVNSPGGMEGAIQINANGGASPYFVDWSGPNNSMGSLDLSNSNILSGLIAGTYTITLTDAHGCTTTCQTEIIQLTNNDDCDGIIDLGVAPFCQPSVFFSNIDATPSDIGFGNSPSCFNGGVAENDVWFSFTTNDTIFQYSIFLTGISDGVNPPLINPQIALYRGDCMVDGLAELFCVSAEEGAQMVQLDALGLTPSITYFLRISDYPTDGTPNEGTFQLCIEESICNDFQVADSSFEGPSCSIADNGFASVLLTGGTPPFTYQWSNGDTNAVAMNLEEGPINVTITDANFCSAFRSFNLSASNPIELTCPDDIMLLIEADSSGIFLDIPAPGTNNCPLDSVYFSLSGATTLAQQAGTVEVQFFNVGITTVTYMVPGVDTCTATVSIEQVTPPCDDLAVVPNLVASPTCNNSADGIIQVTVSGGDGNYDFNWSNGATTEDISALPEGVYLLTINDGSGCTVTAGFWLQAPDGPMLECAAESITQVGQISGSITVNISGGMAPYALNYSGTTTGMIDALMPGQYLLEDLPLGDYTLNLTDAEGCTANCMTSIEDLTGLVCNRLQDSLALVALYLAADGSNWTNPWQLDQPMETWVGLAFTPEGCVEEIDLGGRGLSGSLPEALGNMSQLQRLYLYDNFLSGLLPVSLGNVSSLSSIYIYSNLFDGSLPVEWGNLSELIGLSLFNCQLSGTIPDSWGNLSQLQELFLDYNDLEGNIPASFVNLTNLEILEIDNNNLDAELPPLPPNLQRLEIQDNALKFRDLVAQASTLLALDSITYAPQDSIFGTGTFGTTVGSSLNLNLGYSPTASNNEYTWYQDGAVHLTATGGPVPPLVFPSVTLGDAGQYWYQVNNPLLPDLTLYSEAFTIVVNGMPTCGHLNDSLALVDLYNATDGPNWTTTWDLEQPIIFWYGVSSNIDGCVLALDLSNNNLSGQLPEDLNLPRLERLEVNHNNLNGPLPDFYNLPNLLEFRCIYNGFSGPIPDFQALPNLEILNVGNNNLSGPIPDFSGLPLLERLLCNDNQLTGAIPDFSNLPNLLQFSCGDNQLTGNLTDFSNLPALEQYSCSDNLLTGSIPDFLNLPQLELLYCNNNQLSGPIPDFLNIPLLEDFSCNRNQLSGPIPDFSNLPQLIDFSCYDNQLSGAIPDFSNLPQLELLICFNNQLTGTIPDLSDNLFSLKRLLGDGNALTFEHILPFLAANEMHIAQNAQTNADRLRYAPQDSIFTDTLITRMVGDNLIVDLAIDDTVTTNLYNWYKDGAFHATIGGDNELVFNNIQLSDAGVYNVQIQNPNAPDLTLFSYDITLIVEGLPTCDRMADSLALVDFYFATDGPNWYNTWDLAQPMDTWYGIFINNEGCVSIIDMDGTVNGSSTEFPPTGNNLSGNLTDIYLTQLERLILRFNNLSGSIPDFSNLQNLNTLDLSRNNITGNIPNFSNLPNLNTLNLSINNLAGTIPNFTTLESLVILDLSSNNLIGSIPDFSNLQNLGVLDLGSNSLIGSIPNFSNLQNLNSLIVSINELEGNLPDFSNLPELQTLEVSWNELSGNIPDFSNLPILRYLFFVGNKINGVIPDYSDNMPNLTRILSNDNLLTFEHILPFIDENESLIASNAGTIQDIYKYFPQQRIFTDTLISRGLGANLTIDLAIDDTVTTNIYYWFKDGMPFDTIVGSNELIFTDIQASDTGVYNVQVQNPNAPDLTLFSHDITLNVNTLIVCDNFIVFYSNLQGPSCSEPDNGFATVFVLAGTPPYTYLWSNGDTTATATGLSAQSYSVTVMDSEGCGDTLTTNLEAFNPLVLSCPADISLLIEADSSGIFLDIPAPDANGCPLDDLLYSMEGATVATDQPGPVGVQFFNVGLTTISYFVPGVDTCTFTVTIEQVVPPCDDFAVVPNQVSSPSCSDGEDGFIQMTVSGGDGNYSFDWSNGENTEDLTGLAAGVYIVTITDGNDCEVSAGFWLQAPDSLELACSALPITQFGQLQGTIEVSISGGTAPYTLSYSGASSDMFLINQAGTISLGNLLLGNYTITITDAQGCTTTCQSVLESTCSLSCPDDISLLIEADSTGIFLDIAGPMTGGCSLDSVSFTLSGATVIPETPGVVGIQFFNVGITTVTYFAPGQTPCSFIVDIQQVVPPCDDFALVPNMVQSPSCNDAADGQILITVSGGDGNYSYSWSNGESTEDLTGLTAGVYILTLTDGNDCEVSAGFWLQAPDSLSLSCTPNMASNGQANGSVQFDFAGGVPPYTIDYSGPAMGSLSANTAGLLNVMNLPAGDYSAIITDANNCQTSCSFTILEEVVCDLEISTFQITNVSCAGEADGAINMTVTTRGTLTTIDWEDDMLDGQLNPSGLSPGSYMVTLTDDLQCTISDTFIVTEPPLIQLSCSQLQAVSTMGGNDGIGQVMISGGVLPFSLSYTGPVSGSIPIVGQGTTNLTDLSAGDYTVIVTDANDCMVECTFTIEEPECMLELTFEKTDETCAELDDGTITIIPLGAIEPVTYDWGNDDYDGLFFLDNLEPGDYDITITDAAGCSQSTTIKIVDGELLVFDEIASIPPLCDMNDGIITINMNGGTPPYEYSINGGIDFQFDPNFASLAPGSYNIVVRDQTPCEAIMEFELIETPGPVLENIISTQSLCGRATGSITVVASGGTGVLQYSLDNGPLQPEPFFDNLAAGVYIVRVFDENDCVRAEAGLIEEIFDLEPIVTEIVDPSCAGDDGSFVVDANGGVPPYTYDIGNGEQDNGEFTDLTPDTYFISVYDANGCPGFIEQTLVATTVLNIDAEVQPPTCPGDTDGAINLIFDASGGGNFTIDWDNNALDGLPNPTGLAAGIYTVTVSDDNGCSGIETIELVAAGEIETRAIVTNASCPGEADGSIELEILGGTPPIEVLWNTGATTFELNNLLSGTYTLTITDGNGCTSSMVTTTALRNSVAETIAISDAPLSIPLLVDAFPNDMVLESGAQLYQVCLELEHPDMAELNIDLQCPDGNQISLHTGNMTSAALNGFYCWTIAVPDSWNTYAAANLPATLPESDYAPEDSFDNLVGCSLEGVWTMDITDTQTGNDGTFFSWELQFVVDSNAIKIDVGETPGIPEPLFDTAINDQTVQFTNLTEREAIFNWDFGDGFSSGETSPLHTYANDGVYTVCLTATNDCGEATVCETIVIGTAIPPDLTFISGCAAGAPGDTVLVPFYATDFTDVLGFNFSIISEDDNLAQINDIENNALNQAGLITQLFGDSLMTVAWFDPNTQGLSLPDSTVLFWVETILGTDQDSCTSLQIVNSPTSIFAAVLEDGTDISFIPNVVNECEVCILPNVNKSGIIAREDDAPVADVAVFCNDDQFVLTDIDGYYEFVDLPVGEDFAIRPERDGDDQNGVDILDVVKIQSHILARQLLDSPYKRIAADVSNDTDINIIDITTMMQLILAAITEFPDNTSWRFVPKAYIFPDPEDPFVPTFPEEILLPDLLMDAPNQDFVAIKNGDVTLNASVNLDQDDLTTHAAQQLRLAINDQSLKAGEEVWLPVYADEFDELSGFQLELELDESLEYLGVQPGQLPGLAKANFYHNKQKAGRLAVAWYAPDQRSEWLSWPEDLPLFSIKVRAKRHLQSLHTNISIGDAFTPARAYLRGDFRIGISLDVHKATAIFAPDKLTFRLLDNIPDPFNQDTRIRFEIGYSEPVKITIFDGSGQLVYEHTFPAQPGLNQISISQSNLNGPGVYFYRVATSRHFDVKRMIFQE